MTADPAANEHRARTRRVGVSAFFKIVATSTDKRPDPFTIQQLAMPISTVSSNQSAPWSAEDHAFAMGKTCLLRTHHLQETALEIFSEEDIVGIDTDHSWADQFEVLSFADGSVSCIPHHFFHDELDESAPIGNLYIGRCAIIGAGSRIRYGSDNQSLHIGRFVTIGNRLRVLLNSRCEARTLSTFALSLIGQGLQNVSPPLAGDVVIKNDVWIGDDVTLMGGCVIEDGCVVEAGSVVPADFQTEPFGVYGGNPVRLQHYRFSESIRRALADITWWNNSMEWISANNRAFLFDMNTDEKSTLEALNEIHSTTTQPAPAEPETNQPTGEKIRAQQELTEPPTDSTSPNDTIKNFFNPVFWGTKDPELFASLIKIATQQTEAYHFADNMFVFQRNNSMLHDQKFIESWKNNSVSASDTAIIWRRYIMAMAGFHCSHLAGDFVECGAYEGVGAKTILDYLGGPDFPKKFWLYDIFEHNSEMLNHAMPSHGPNLYKQVCERFSDYSNVNIFKGFLPEVLSQGCPEKIAYLHIDLNQAPAEIATLNALFERVVSGGIIILDDYEMFFYRDQKHAEDNWFAERGYKVFPLPTSQGIVIKR